MNTATRFAAPTRRDFLKASGALVVGFSCINAVSAKTGVDALMPAKSVAKDAVESFLSIGRDGQITVYVGKVDLDRKSTRLNSSHG